MDINQILKDIGQTADPALNESGLFVSLLTLLVRDLFIVAILVATYLVLRYTRQASVAVIKRNFVGYFRRQISENNAYFVTTNYAKLT